MDLGLVPYVATSEMFLKHLDLSIFGGREIVRVLENQEHRNFHEAYLVSNSLAFGNPDLKMPNWVYIDCVLMQTAAIGFAIPREIAPDALVTFYEADPYVDVKTLDYIPISGQIAAVGADRDSLIGFSLFSLRRQLPNIQPPKLGCLTKLAAMYVYRAEEMARFVGTTQYDNIALSTHALFGKKTYIDQPMIPLHPLREMSFIYSMKVELDESRILGGFSGNDARDYDFLMAADDMAKKMQIQEGLHAGKKFYIQDPVQIRKDDKIYLPVSMEGT